MSIDMNNKGAQTGAILLVAALVVFAWNLGYKQAANSLLTEEKTPSVSSVLEDIYSYKGSSDANAKSTNKVYNASPVVAGRESVAVGDQQAGMEVKVSSLSLSEIGWVGVRDADGRVLGAGRFDAGNFVNVTVPLLRATVAGESYQVLLYADDGDKEFDLHKDSLITDTNDGVGGTTFTAL